MLHGDENEKISRYGHDKLTTYGLLKEAPAATIREWVYQLISLDVLDQTDDDYPLLKLNPQSWEVMRNERQVQMRQTAKRSRARKPMTEEESWQGVDRELCERLRRWRRETAEEKGWPPLAIFSDNTLRDLARVRPTTSANLRTVQGIGDAKAQAFGDALLAIVAPWCEEKKIASDRIDPGASRSSSKESAGSALAYYGQFRRGDSLEQVVASSGRTLSTVVKYLCFFIEAERPARVDAWVPPDVQHRILKVAEKTGAVLLRPIFEALNEEVSYEMIRITLAHAGVAG